MANLFGTIGLIFLAVVLWQSGHAWWRHHQATKLLTEGLRVSGEVVSRELRAGIAKGVRRHPFTVAFHAGAEQPAEETYTGPVGGFVPVPGEQVTVRYSSGDPSDFTVEGMPTLPWRPTVLRVTGLSLLLLAGLAMAVLGFGLVPVSAAGGEEPWDIMWGWGYTAAPVLVGIWGLVFIADLLRTTISEAALRQGARQTPGVIQDSWGETARMNPVFGMVQPARRSRTGFSFSVRFQLPDGQETTARCPQWAEGLSVEAGQGVTVLHRVENPADFRVAEVPDRAKLYRILQIASAVLMLAVLVGITVT